MTEETTEPARDEPSAEEMLKESARIWEEATRKYQGAFTDVSEFFEVPEFERYVHIPFYQQYPLHYGPRYYPPGNFVVWGSRIHKGEAGELTLSDAAKSEEGKTSTQPAPDVATEEAVKILVRSAIAETERARAIIRRDQEEIERLKQETRAILTRLMVA